MPLWKSHQLLLSLFVGILMTMITPRVSAQSSTLDGRGGGIDPGAGKDFPKAVAEEVNQTLVNTTIDSGPVINTTIDRGIIYSTTVRIAGARWLRLTFDEALLGTPLPYGERTLLRITSLLDGAVQTMNAMHLQQWRNTSAYFNGESVRIEIIAEPQAETSRLKISAVMAGFDGGNTEKSICGNTDDRSLSRDPRSGRTLPTICTAWLISEVNTGGRSGCFLTAGHCFSGNAPPNVVEFNVPLSSGGGSINHPPPEDQYAVDLDSRQWTPEAGLGNDWAYFACFPNSNTGLTPLQAQGDAHVLAAAIPDAAGQSTIITGFGSTSSPVSNTWNLVQKTHQGTLNFHLGTVLGYRVDTTSGNSGTAIEFPDSAEAIGIHTNGGCGFLASTLNWGTSIANLGLQHALANPLGLCWPCTGIDTDENAIVNVADLLFQLSNWGACASPCPGDVNLDGMISVTDLLALLSNWGPCPLGGPGPFVPTLPVNDFCIDAIPVFDGSTEFDTTYATTDGPAHPTCEKGGDGGITAKDLWFLYTATCTGLLDISTCGTSSFDSDLVIYDGSDCTSLTLLACNDDALTLPCGQNPLWQSHITDVSVTLGNLYLIRVGVWAESTPPGPGILNITCGQED